MIWIWGIITAAALILEFCTADLISIWFAAGGFITLISVAFWPNIPIVWQCTIFVVVSCALLLCTRKIFKKFLKKDDVKTNSDSFIGMTFILSKVDTGNNCTYHKIADVEWRVVGENNYQLANGDKVEIVSLSGNKLVVKKIESAELKETSSQEKPTVVKKENNSDSSKTTANGTSKSKKVTKKTNLKKGDK